MALRLDKFLTLYFFHPLLSNVNRKSKLRIPILMYHSISNDIKMGGHPYFEVCTSPQVFDKHLMFLQDQGYTSINIKEAADILSWKKTSPSKPVCITFDDGFRDFVTQAFPILKRHGFSATVFLATDFVGNKQGGFKNRECLTWEDIRHLREEGVTFGSHTVTHAKLTELTQNELEMELKDSRLKIEEELQEAIDCFSYPFAFPGEKTAFVTNLKKSLTSAAYECGVTTKVGRATEASDPLFLPRLPVNDFDDLAFFWAKLDGAYDWLYKAQRSFKMTVMLLNYIKLGQKKAMLSKSGS